MFQNDSLNFVKKEGLCVLLAKLAIHSGIEQALYPVLPIHVECGTHKQAEILWSLPTYC